MEIEVRKHWAQPEFFSALGFINIEGNKFNRTRRVMMNHQVYDQAIELSVYEEHPELGVEIEVRWDGVLYISGYWHDEEDFKKDREIW